MPAGKENARKRNAPAAPRPVLTIEVIEGPTKGQKFTKQVRPKLRGRARARVRSHTSAAVIRASSPASLSTVRKFPSRFRPACASCPCPHARLTRKKQNARPAVVTPPSSQADAFQIGRTRSNAVYIKDPTVSQKHARVEWTGSAYTITDLGSSNGTTVNEEEIDEGEPRVIGHGDVVVVGTDTVVKISVAAAPEEAEAPAKLPRGAAARAAAAAKREAAAAKREEAAAKAARTREARRAEAEAEAEAEARREAAEAAEAAARLEPDLSPRDESVTVEAFLTRTADVLIGQVRNLAEAEVAALRKETEAVKAELRAAAAAR